MNINSTQIEFSGTWSRIVPEKRYVLLYVVSIVVVAALYISFHIVDSFRSYWAFYIEQILLSASIVAMILRAVTSSGARSRRFWWLLTGANTCYLISYLPYSATDWDIDWSAHKTLIDNTLNIMYYAGVLLAATVRPHIPSDIKKTNARRWTETTANGIFAMAIVTYIVILPFASKVGVDTTYAHTLVFYATMDVCVASCFYILVRQSENPGWKVLYALLALESIVWAVLNISEIFIFYGVWAYEPGTLIDLAWLVPYVLLFLAAAARTNRSSVETASAGDSYNISMAQSDGRPRLILYLATLPVIHLLLYALGSLDPALKSPREFVILFFGLLLGIAAITYNRHYERELRLVLRSFRYTQKLEILGKMAAYVAHDFKNAMMVINGYSDFLLESGKFDRETTERLERIREAGKNGALLTEKMLLFSRQSSVRHEFLDLNEIVEDTVSFLDGIVGEHIIIDFQPAESLWNVYGDKALLTQLVTNVIVNAREAIPTGGKISLSTSNMKGSNERTGYFRAALTAGDQVVLTISDDGRGMDDETRKRAFDPFFTTKSPGQGPGLGLSAALGIVTQHSGDILIRSNPSKGTAVEIHIPRVSEKHTLIKTS